MYLRRSSTTDVEHREHSSRNYRQNRGMLDTIHPPFLYSSSTQAVHNNKEHSNRLRDRILQLLAVILMAVKESTSGRKDEAALSHNLTRFQGWVVALSIDTSVAHIPW